MTTTVKIKPVCTHCGSDDVTTDAIARWNVTTQQWELSSELDNTDCENCGGECNLKWVVAS